MGCVCSSLVDQKDVQIWSWLEASGCFVECDRCRRHANKPWRGLSSAEKAEWRIIVLEQSKSSLAHGVSQPLDGCNRHAGTSEEVVGEAERNARGDASAVGEAGGLSPQLSTPFVVMCVPCAATYQQEMEKFKKERQYYANAKAMLYPKERLRTALRRITTGEQWENTESFHAKYKPDSVLERLGEEEDRGLEDVDSMLNGEGDVTIVVEESIELEDVKYEEEDGKDVHDDRASVSLKN
jgi:hypothetical protein